MYRLLHTVILFIGDQSHGRDAIVFVLFASVCRCICLRLYIVSVTSCPSWVIDHYMKSNDSHMSQKCRIIQVKYELQKMG